MLLKVANMAENADEKTVSGAFLQLNRLRSVTEEARMTFNRVLAEVSPGKQAGGEVRGS
jgi:hypothetical protein